MVPFLGETSLFDSGFFAFRSSSRTLYHSEDLKLLNILFNNDLVFLFLSTWYLTIWNQWLWEHLGLLESSKAVHLLSSLSLYFKRKQTFLPHSYFSGWFLISKLFWVSELSFRSVLYQFHSLVRNAVITLTISFIVIYNFTKALIFSVWISKLLIRVPFIT